ncbi:hypothetical protein DNU06_12750 [Putridiphycobacter roseus]|uniref:Plasmid pRiA4b Orf3-like domain-containing protein n=1 Tax=Putridiphycobacter roseus TaxID=2219161 RepID=A0A2W1NBG2_9FLAO|nr:hypothetical protein [Putridiphycobacter roseus]PZE16413.1 hypothetical protein DNU06_12750 [Putridiphycobacter roseus]
MSTYKFRVLLDNSDHEEIFRDIEIDGEHNFENFYQKIIESFFFQGDQMASFYVSNNDWDKGEEIGLFALESEDSFEPYHIMQESKIKNFVDKKDQRFILVYDFLKMWIFLIELIHIDETATLAAPEIILSIGIAPREASREIDFGLPSTDSGDDFGLGNDFDDIFSEFEDEEDFEGFDNIDDYDI